MTNPRCNLHNAIFSRMRRGATLGEATMALILMGVIVVVSAQFVVFQARQREAAFQRAIALEAADNTMDYLFALPWGELTAEQVRSIELPASIENQLSAGALTIEVHENSASPGTKQLVVQLNWRDAVGQQVRPLQLVAWRSAVRGSAEEE